MQASLALVHHANQYLITNGYDNREGLAAVLGSRVTGSGLTAVLDLHRKFGIPLNLHISGTLLEAIAWHHPEFLKLLRKLLQSRLIDLVGSSYGQNIMRFFGPDYNRKQLNEELRLYQTHLGVEPANIHIFWPPERVWETRSMAPVLRDANLLNGGYRYVIVDDRLLLSPRDRRLPRHIYDEGGHWDAELFRTHQIENGLGLTVFPIATNLRRSIPPREKEDWSEVQAQLEGLLVHARENDDANLLAIYADDMEKVAGIGEWGKEGPERYKAFLKWVADNSWVRPVKLSEWAAANEPAGRRRIETGTFGELATEFDAGEGYEKWFLAEDWAPYRQSFEWAESRVKELAAKGADAGLMELAEKQLLVGNWETAWHTPPTGPHGDATCNGHASPWARALTSHSRHAAVTAEAAHWMRHKDGRAHACRLDIDNDGEEDVVIKNDHVFLVISPANGGRVIAMFWISGERGAMVVGNPCDDWNWMEDLNKYMDVPRNHPGAFADVGYEHDAYGSEFVQSEGECVIVRLRNIQEGSRAKGLIKEFRLEAGASELRVRYRLPKGLSPFSTEAGLSPDYLQLLRNGSAGMKAVKGRGYRGWSNHGAAVWLKLIPGGGLRWQRPYQEEFGHGRMLRLGTSAEEFEIALVTSKVPAASSEAPRAYSRRLAREAA